MLKQPMAYHRTTLGMSESAKRTLGMANTKLALGTVSISQDDGQ